jgi:hypothetical protein
LKRGQSDEVISFISVFTQIIMSTTDTKLTQRLNVDLPKAEYFALKSYALHQDTTVSQLVRDSLRSIVDYDTWFQARVKRAMADKRAPLSEAEWAAIRAGKLAERARLLAAPSKSKKVRAGQVA